jgi:hypothetical protein
VDRANEQGGPDNITVVAARFEGEGLGVAEPDQHVGHAVYRLPGSDTPTDPHGEFVPGGGEVAGAGPERRDRGGVGSRLWTILLIVLVLIAALLLAARELHDGAPVQGAESETQQQ